MDHQSLSNAVVPPGALQSLSPPMALPMMSMLYRHKGSANGNGATPSSPEPHNLHLVVLTEKASLAAIDSEPRGSRPWARDDSGAAYDDVDWDSIGERCKAKGVACSCVIVGSEASRTTASLGRDGSASAERLRKMCQAVSVCAAARDNIQVHPRPPPSRPANNARTEFCRRTRRTLVPTTSRFGRLSHGAGYQR